MHESYLAKFIVHLMVTIFSILVLWSSNATAKDSFYVIPVKKGNTHDYDFSKVRTLVLPNGNLQFQNVMVNDEHLMFELPMGGIIDLVNLGTMSTVEIPTANITIDGNHSDWWTTDIHEHTEYVVEPLHSDPSGDVNYNGPPGDSTGVDIKAVFVARDETYIYAAFTLYNQCSTNVLYMFELMQYHDQMHTPGDTMIMLFDNDLQIAYREDPSGGVSYDNSYFKYSIDPGIGFIEFKVPIQDVEYDCGGCCPRIGIEGRIIRMYAHKIDVNYYDEAGWENRKMIYNFY